MKKIMSLVMAVAVLICTLWFSAGSASAEGTITYTGARFVWGKGVVFVFEASGYRNRDVKNASLSIGPDSFGLHCHVNKKAGKIICVAGSGLTRYAGQIGILSLAGYAFYVKIPDRPPLQYSNQSISCPPGTEPGAMVRFVIYEGYSTTTFISGSTLAEVSANAANWRGGDYLRIDSIGDLVCKPTN